MRLQSTLILIFYDLFKVVNKSVCWLMVPFSLVGTSTESVSLLCHFTPIILLEGGPYRSTVTGLGVRLFEYGFSIARVFFGFYCLSFRYLMVRSTFFPQIIGVLLAIQGFCCLINSLANFVAPEFAGRFFPVLMASGAAEISLCSWLLVAGVNVQRWNEQAGAVTASIRT